MKVCFFPHELHESFFPVAQDWLIKLALTCSTAALPTCQYYPRHLFSVTQVMARHSKVRVLVILFHHVTL